ncbi:MAG TPA: MBL fold metallo-hydrolase [Gemmatimonadaceae bacterium]|jgi:N-acyl-phosphatidylethanolamine-hydrolysing phospholipase D|nr:MBL fold metallo-hydrolase [Gemmatimonadaceae bacterium]
MTRPSHHAPGGGFRNPWGDDDGPHSFGDVLRWRFSEEARRARTSDGSQPVAAVPSAFATPAAGRDTLTTTWVGHSTVLLQLGGVNVLTDPMWSQRASPVSWAGPARLSPPGVSLDALPPIHVVLISHNHYDHLDRATVQRLAARHPDAVWFAPLGVRPLLQRWGARDVSELDWWDTESAGGVQASCVPARHFSARGLNDRGRTLWCGWTVTANGWRAYFAGDTALHPEFGEISRRHGPFDVALIPVGAYEPRWFMQRVHMNPDDAVQAYEAVRRAWPEAPPPAMLPIHWGTFRLTDEPMDEPPRRTHALWEAAGLASGDLWLSAPGQTHHRQRGDQRAMLVAIPKPLIP